MNPAATPDEAALLPPDTRELSLDDAFQLAVRMHREDRLDGARTLYQRILQAAPDHADALCLLGVVEHQMGRSEHGLKLLHQAVERVPTFPGFRINLGNVLVEMNRLDAALKAYQAAAELDGSMADVHNNIGAVQRAMGQPEQARASYDRALALDPKHVRAWNNIGLLHDGQGKLDEAMSAYLTAIELWPGHGMSALRLGLLYHRLGRVERAMAVFRQWIARDPDNPVPKHLLAACTGQEVPDRACDEYVQAEFDGFAASFESVLNERLHYQAPQLCANLLASQLAAPQGQLALLDAGCGTGLCGPLLKPWAGELVGVDLSGGMLAKARNKGVYDELVQAELGAYLLQGPERWDAINCADTLCYFGDLTQLMAAAAVALRPGALFVFTVEALDDDSADRASILPSGRYAHGRAHIDRTATAAGLSLLQAKREVLRHESDAPVHGWVVAVRRAA